MSLHMYFAPPHTLVDLPVTNEAHAKTLKQVVVEEKTDSWIKLDEKVSWTHRKQFAK